MSQFGPPPSNPNPFQAPPFEPKPVAAPAAVGPFHFEYLRSYNYIFENPNWTMNVLWGFLCILSSAVIPVLGQLVFMGYQFEVAESLIKNRGTRYPDFDINRFADYLGRSIWPFLVQLLLAVPWVVVMYIGLIVVFLLAGAGAAIGGDEAGPVLATVFGVLGFFLWMAVMVLGFAVMTPMIMKAGLAQDFAAGFDLGWAIDFLKKNWVELFLGSLFLGFSGMLVMLLGCVALVVGMYAGMAVMMLAQAYMMYQFYMLHLSRGGQPIAFKPQMPVAPQGYMPPPGGYPPQQF
jgi:hypothetical protein